MMAIKGGILASFQNFNTTNSDVKEVKKMIRSDIEKLRNSQTFFLYRQMFQKALDKWIVHGQNAFAAFFKSNYSPFSTNGSLVERQMRCAWFLRASGIMGVLPSQNAIETQMKKIKGMYLRLYFTIILRNNNAAALFTQHALLNPLKKHRKCTQRGKDGHGRFFDQWCSRNGSSE